MALDLTWLSCDLATGVIVEELPDLVPSGQLAATLATITSVTFGLPIPLNSARDWAAATWPGRTMIVPVLAGQPIAAYAVLTRRRGTGPVLPLSCASLECYLDRRYVGDHAWAGVDEATIMAGLFGDADLEGIDFTVDAPATGVLHDAEYWSYDDKTVYSAARERMSRAGGLEWAVVLGWADASQSTVSKTIQVRARIGQASATPTAVFETAGASSTTYEMVEDYSRGKGANHILAVSSGQGQARPQSAPARDEAQLAGGWPRWEHRYTPSTSISDTDTLDRHATAALSLMSTGTRALTITGRADADPLLGRDWHIGDDLGYQLVGHGHPDGLAGVGRAVGWSLDPKAETITPVLLLPGEEV